MRGKVDPSDLVQQTLLDAWHGEPGFRGNTHGQRLAWLRVILRRVVLQKQRADMTLKRGEGKERVIADAIGRTSLRIEELAVGREPAPDEVVDHAEQTLVVADALDKLPEDYRRVIEMRHFEHLSHVSIAHQLDRTPEATRMLWVRALIKLREAVRNDNDSSPSTN